MALIPKPPYPNVPLTTGVPSLPRLAELPQQVQSIFGILESALWDKVGRKPVWGIFDQQGKPVAIADSVLDLSYRNESKISGFPVQAGSFANYNKVNNPYEARVTLIKGSNNSINPLTNSILNNGSSVVGRGDFLKAIDEAAKSLELFNIVTPERNYLKANIEGYDYRRESSNGANLLIVELRLIEIREVTAKYAQSKEKPTTENSKEASAKPTQTSGNVQAKIPNDSVLKQISNINWSDLGNRVIAGIGNLL